MILRLQIHPYKTKAQIQDDSAARNSSLQKSRMQRRAQHKPQTLLQSSRQAILPQTGAKKE